jgi:hypothetical protein
MLTIKEKMIIARILESFKFSMPEELYHKLFEQLGLYHITYYFAMYQLIEMAEGFFKNTKKDLRIEQENGPILLWLQTLKHHLNQGYNLGQLVELYRKDYNQNLFEEFKSYTNQYLPHTPDML